MSKHHPDFALYHAAIAADSAFEAELQRAYGPSKAPDARYKPRHEDSRVTHAAEAKVAADWQWHESCATARGEQA